MKIERKYGKKIVVAEDGHAYTYEMGYLMCTPLFVDDDYDDDFAPVEETPYYMKSYFRKILNKLGIKNKKNQDKIFRHITFYAEPPNVKIIDGKRYEYTNTFSTKKEAEYFAKMYRKQGNNARIIQMGDEFTVYTRL